MGRNRNYKVLKDPSSRNTDDGPSASSSYSLNLPENTVSPEKLMPAISSVLKDTNIIENYINEKDLLNHSNTKSSSYKELANQLKEDENLIQKISQAVINAVLQNDTFKQMLFEALTLEFDTKLESLEKSIKSLKKENLTLSMQAEEQQQYSRRNCLVVHGIPTPLNKEDTDEAIVKFCKNHLKIDLQDRDIDRSHRLGKNGRGPIIVKFCRHNIKQKIYFSKKLLKNKNYLITESLTSTRVSAMKALKKLKDEGKITSFWSIDGKLHYILANNPEKKLTINPFEIDKLLTV